MPDKQPLPEPSPEAIGPFLCRIKYLNDGGWFSQEWAVLTRPHSKEKGYHWSVDGGVEVIFWKSLDEMFPDLSNLKQGDSPERRYKLKSDGDGHNFIVPVDKEAEFNSCLESVYDESTEEELPMPDDVISIGGSPTRVTFTDPKIN